MKVTMIAIVVGTLGKFPKGTGRLGNKRTSRDHPDYSILKIGQKSRRLEETCCHSDFREKSLVRTDEKNSRGVKQRQ